MSGLAWETRHETKEALLSSRRHGRRPFLPNAPKGYIPRWDQQRSDLQEHGLNAHKRLNLQAFSRPKSEPLNRSSLVSKSVPSETVRLLCLSPCLIEHFSNSLRNTETSDTYGTTLAVVLSERRWNIPFRGDGQKRPSSVSPRLPRVINKYVIYLIHSPLRVSAGTPSDRNGGRKRIPA